MKSVEALLRLGWSYFLMWSNFFDKPASTWLENALLAENTLTQSICQRADGRRWLAMPAAS